MLLALFAPLANLQEPPKIVLQGGTFVVSAARISDSVVIVPPKAAHDLATGIFETSLGGVTVRFDGNGLRVGKPGKLKPYPLKAFATSPRLSQPEDIKHTVAEVAAGRRSFEPAAVSGYEKVGQTLYVLFRWESIAKATWMEAVAAFESAPAGVRVRALARIEGSSLARTRTDDRLFKRAGMLVALVNKGAEFGEAQVDVGSATSSFQAAGAAVGGAVYATGMEDVYTTMPSGKGVVLVGARTLKSGASRPLLELRGQVARILPEGYLRATDGSDTWLVNLWTGAQYPCLVDSGQSHTALGLLLWSPRRAPVYASLYDAHFRRIAGWKRPGAS